MVAEKKYSQKSCELLAAKVNSVAELPAECREIPAVVESVQKKVAAFDGMTPKSAADAARARRGGRESHAQIQRRMTTRREWKKWGVTSLTREAHPCVTDLYY